MNSRSLVYLAGATLLVAVVAAVTLHRRESAVEAGPEAGKLFPKFVDSVNDVTVVTIQRKDGVTTLRRTGDVWGLGEKGGYPVDLGAVRKTLIGLSNLEAAEPKTDDPKLYSKIGVDDPGTEGSTAALVTAKDANGKDLLSLIVGKEHPSKSFTGGHQVYVRKPGEARSWLASGDLELKEKPADWLDKKILEIKRERVRSVEIHPADGEVVLVDRDKPETKDFTLHDIPEGKELSYPSAPSSIADALGYLNLEDVATAADVDMKEGASGTAKFSCFDGLTITVTTKGVGDKTYARFEASYEKPPEASGPALPEPEAKKDEDPDKPAANKAAEKPKPKTPEEVQKEVADLNSRLANWVYQIPSYNKSSFEKKKSELLKDKAPPAPPPAETAPPSSEPPKAAPAPTPPDAKPPEKPSEKPPR
jgi:hypothetical protein